jgi:hypothetical protein
MGLSMMFLAPIHGYELLFECGNLWLNMENIQWDLMGASGI